MIEFLKVIISPGMLPFTVLLGLVILFWFIALLGFLDFEILDFGDFGLDALDGLDEVGESLEAAGNSVSAFDAILGFLNVGSVPVSIILSFVIVKMWLMALFLNLFLPSSLRNAVPLLVFIVISLLLLGIICLFLTGLTTKPLRKYFKNVTTHGHHHLIGKICKIKSSEVSDTFGQAEIKVDYSYLLISVRNFNKESKFEMGEEVVITNYNKEKDFYEITKI